MTESRKTRKFNVHFMPDDITVPSVEGENLLRLAVEHGIHVDANCGGAGACGKCKVKVEGEAKSLDTKKKIELDEGEFLACRTEVHGDLTVTVPEATRVRGKLPSRTQEDSTDRIRLKGLDVDKVVTDCGLKPLMDKVHVDVPLPDAENNLPDRFRLFAALKGKIGKTDDKTVAYPVLKKLPSIMREQNGSVTATVIGSHMEEFEATLPTVVDLVAGDTSEEFYGIAIDIGTTSVWTNWLDLRKGTVLAQAADYNDQIRFGADVINRILASKKPGGLEKVQGAVVDTINRLIKQMSEEIGIGTDKISLMVAAGNTTMTHIFLGIDPSYIQLAPHTPASRFMPSLRAAELGIDVHEQAYLYCIPAISAWVGGDIVAGTLVSGFASQEKLTLFIDMGTNGEIVLGNQDFLISASCSAGPAFEGGEIRDGVRAMAGAIEDFHLNSANATPMVLTIDQKPAVGICGSGLINVIAGLFLTGVLQPDGKFNTSLGVERLKEGPDGWEYVLMPGELSATGKDIGITEVDIDNLMRAKSAVYAGIRTLLSTMGMEAEMIEQVLIAGSFGQSIDIEKAITIGLLPDLPPDRYRFIGNSSLMGARLSAQCSKGMAEGDRIASKITYVDLGATNTFMDEYMGGMFIPHTNKLYFPSVAAMMEQNNGK